jgi:hypothetical protein
MRDANRLRRLVWIGPAPAGGGEQAIALGRRRTPTVAH